MEEMVRFVAGLVFSALVSGGVLVAADAGDELAARHPGTVRSEPAVLCPVRVTAPVLRVRARPLLDAAVVGHLRRGTVVPAAQRVHRGSGLTWRRVGEGYVAARYLRPTAGVCTTL